MQHEHGLGPPIPIKWRGVHKNVNNRGGEEGEMTSKYEILSFTDIGYAVQHTVPRAQ